MASTDLSVFDFDPRNPHFHYNSRFSWPIPTNDALPSQATSTQFKRSTSPSPLPAGALSYQQTTSHTPGALLPDWQMASQAPNSSFALDTSSYGPQSYDPYVIPFQTSPTDYLAPNPSFDANVGVNMAAGLQMNASYLALQDTMNHMNQMGPFSTQGWDEIMGTGYQQDISIPGQQVFTADAFTSETFTSEAFVSGSPSEGTGLEVRSLSSSDNGWAAIDHHHHPHIGAIFNPEQTLHPRTFSDSSSYSDGVEQPMRNSWDNFVVVPHAMNSPSTDSADETDLYTKQSYYRDTERLSPPLTLTPSSVQPITIRQPTSPTSLLSRRQPQKSAVVKSVKAATRRPSQATKNETEKRVGRRKGPLSSEQRKQAFEIRKLGACLRCRFLKKVCDKGEPCGGCKPSHARLWQVPCTRIDIKDIAYFMKDWKADYERHVSLGFSIGNIKGFSDQERLLFVTHGFGPHIVVKAREVYVRDERCFGMNWVESPEGTQHEHEVNTAKLSAGSEGIPVEALSAYLDQHVEGGFEKFVEDYFQGTPFISEILKTAYRYWLAERTPVIKKALKLVVAYNLTQHVTMLSGIPEEENFVGKIEDEDSILRGQTVAPVMINFQIKCAMADMWRELQKDVLEELSTLYSSVYSKDKLKHWPTIFMLASILLAVWEEMQFDCRYRIPDAAVVEKFCTDMETTPVGVIVGLFQAISQKLPPFSEWDRQKHHMLLNSNIAVCDALDDVRKNVARYDKYLRTRSQATFDRSDFDSLSNKFVSKLVIRAN